MMNNFHQNNFPVEALSPRLKNLAWEIHHDTGAPIASIVSALLVVISLVCQGKAKVKKREGLTSPLSLWFIVILGSGERKSTVVKALLKGVEAFLVEQSKVVEEEAKKFEIRLVTWKAELKGLLGLLRKGTEKGEATDVIHKRIEEHNVKKPLKPKRFKLMHEKVTPLALIKNLSKCYPTTGLISDEASCVFSGRGLSDMGLMNKGWDGSTLLHDSGEDSFEVLDPALTMALYVQREIFDEFHRSKGDLAKGVGFFSRCFVVAPQETAGTRNLAYKSPTFHGASDEFYSRCKEILRSHIAESGQELAPKIELIFVPEAQARWEEVHDHIESLMNVGGLFYEHKDFGSKHADKIARLAALFHYFEGSKGSISLETLERSIAISGWYAEEYVRNFTKPPQISPEEKDANELLLWLANYVWVTNGAMTIEKNNIRQNGPNSIRSKTKLNSALYFLSQQGVVWETRYQNQKTTYVCLSQSYFTQQQVQLLCSQRYARG